MSNAPSVLWPVALLVFAGQLAAQTPKQRYESLLAEYIKAVGAWTEQYEPGGKQAADVQTLARYEDWPTWTFLPRFMALAEQNPNDPAASDALVWIVDQGQAIGLNDKEYYPFLVRSLEQLERAQILDNRPVQKPRWVMRHPSPATEQYLRSILAKNKNRDVRGRACLYLGELLINRAKFARNPWFDRDSKTPFETFLTLRFHPVVLQYIRATDPHAAAAEGELLLERARSEFGDIKWNGPAKPQPPRDRTIAEMAQLELDELRHPPAAKDAKP